MSLPSAEPPILSVWELTALIKDLLEGSFPAVWVSGEVSNLSSPQSGHIYLTLKDDRAQIRAVLWRTAASRLRFDLQDGMEVLVQGDLDVYAPRGSYQLVIRQIEPKGIGALELALRKLRDKLAAEGLFEPGRKRPLPRFPRRIAFVTSPSGAAVRDFLEVLRRRWRHVEVLIVPARVQGEGAAAEIAAGIALVNRMQTPVDVLVVGRGGGSLEDLWCFNEEIVVRAIHASRIPVVSAVGHEIDVTLSDLVADVRALTPSEAAELIFPDMEQVRATLRGYQQHLASSLQQRAQAARSRLDMLAQRRAFRRPFEYVHDLAQRLDELSVRSTRAIKQRFSVSRQTADKLSAQLDSLSPLGVLGRGYSLTQRLPDGVLLRDSRDVAVGDQIRTRLEHGEIISQVLKTDHRLNERRTNNMKSSEEIRQFLETLMGWGFDRPWMYGGSPFGTDGVFWYWRLIWAELMERTRDFYDTTTAFGHGAGGEPHIPDLSPNLSSDPAAYKPVIDYWRAVDQRLGIQHPPAS